MFNRIFSLFCVVFVSVSASIYTEVATPSPEKQSNEENKEVHPPKIGNFSLPDSQQPLALFGFGGNIIEKGEIQVFFFADALAGKRKLTVDLIPGVLFGITDNWTIFFNFPFTPSFQDGHEHSCGLEDFYIQLEYAFYNKKTTCYAEQATLVGNITFPTGSIRMNPYTGFGSPGLFLGGTYNHMWIDWFLFMAAGGQLTTTEHRTKIGEQFLYQFGFGRNFYTPPGWIYACLLEFDGQYNRKNRINGCFDRHSGGNTIFATPSLWISSKDVIVQFGVSVPIHQNLFGKQNRYDYALNFNFAWSFY